MAYAVITQNGIIVDTFKKVEDANAIVDLDDNLSVYNGQVPIESDIGDYIDSNSGQVMPEGPIPDLFYLDDLKRRIAIKAYTVEDDYRGENWGRLLSEDVNADALSEDYKNRTKVTADLFRAWTGYCWKQVEDFEDINTVVTYTLSNLDDYVKSMETLFDFGMFNFFINQITSKWQGYHSSFQIRTINTETGEGDVLQAQAADMMEWEAWRTVCYKTALTFFLTDVKQV